jgi:hypothetical protein
MSAIASYRTQVLQLLSDPTLAIFSNDMVDQALRWSLSEYSLRRPLIRTYNFTVDASTGLHVLPADFVSREITRVQLYNDDPDSITDLVHYAFRRDESWYIQTKKEVAAGDVLIISYSAVHQIDGLDAAAGTTVPDADENLICLGAAGQAMLNLPRTSL